MQDKSLEFLLEVELCGLATAIENLKLSGLILKIEIKKDVDKPIYTCYDSFGKLHKASTQNDENEWIEFKDIP